jgi:hypothetical protein
MRKSFQNFWKLPLVFAVMLADVPVQQLRAGAVETPLPNFQIPGAKYNVYFQMQDGLRYVIRNSKTHELVGSFSSGFNHVTRTDVTRRDLGLSSTPYFNPEETGVIIDETAGGFFILAVMDQGKFSAIPIPYDRIERLLGSHPKLPKLAWPRWLGNSTLTCRLCDADPQAGSETTLLGASWIVIKIKRDGSLLLLNADE